MHVERADLSRIFHKTAGRGIAEIRERIATKNLNGLEGEFFASQPVYISQLANADGSKIEGLMGRIADEAAANRFGTADLNEFSYWAWRSCGVVEVQMILATELGNGFNKTTMDLIREGLEVGGYNVETDTGWYHKALVKLAEKYGIKGETKKFMPSSEIAREIMEGRYVMVSLKSRLDGGHLLLLYGVNIQGGSLQGFFVHDPFNFGKEGESQFMSKSDFDRLSTRRVIIFEPIRH